MVYNRMHVDKLLPANVLLKRIQLATWGMLAITITLETLYIAASPVDQNTPRNIACIAILTILAMSSIYWPANRSRLFRTSLVLIELVLLCAGSVLGIYRWLWALYLVLVARATMIVDRKDLKLVVAVACVFQFVWYFAKALLAVPEDLRAKMLVTAGLSAFMMTSSTCFLIALVAWMVVLMINEYELRERTIKLARDNEVLAAELERTRIAREIHDTLGHSLTSLKIQLELAGRLLEIGDEKAKDAMAQAEQLAARSLTDTRVALQSIRNTDFNFERAVEELTHEVRSSGAVALHIDLQSTQMSNAVSYQLYRVIQECLTNTLKHAQATDVFIALTNDDGKLQLEVKDNGRGFDGETKGDGFGLKGLKERIASLQGEVQIRSASGEGTSVRVSVPQG